ncbi:MAG: DIP1984 family protein [Anaerolineae bacterium]
MMKLAEALILRADAQTRIQQLRERMARSARVQEGDTAPENPAELIEELTRVVADLRTLMQQINRTNARTPFDEARTLTDALAERDALSIEHSVLAGLLAEATGGNQRYGYNPSNIKYFRAVDVVSVQKRADDLAAARRDLDSRIQALNWTVDLAE